MKQEKDLLEQWSSKFQRVSGADWQEGHAQLRLLRVWSMNPYASQIRYSTPTNSDSVKSVFLNMLFKILRHTKV